MDSLQNIDSTNSLVNTLGLVKHYRRLELSTYDEFKVFLERTFKNDADLVDHLFYKWKYHKKSFGSWFLNLGTENKIKVLHQFGIVDPQDEEFFKLIKEDEELILFFDEAPDTVRLLNSVLLFFCNTNLQNLSGLKFSIKIPSGNKAYGNTANWGDFFLSLKTTQEQENIVIRAITNNLTTLQ